MPKPPRPKKKAVAMPMLSTAAIDASLAYSLRRAQLSTYGAFVESMARFDVRPSQFTVLVLIRSNPGMTQSAVSSALGIQKANFVALLDRLDKRGLTERRKIHGDRRSSALHLTRTGVTFVAKLEAAHAAMEARLCARLGEKRSRQMLDLLHKFADRAEPANEVIHG